MSKNKFTGKSPNPIQDFPKGVEPFDLVDPPKKNIGSVDCDFCGEPIDATSSTPCGNCGR